MGRKDNARIVLLRHQRRLRELPRIRVTLEVILLADAAETCPEDLLASGLLPL